MNKDNQIMNLLSDIDEELIDDILEIPQRPKNNSGAVRASSKSLFAKFALPIAACLAVAAVSVGVLVFSGKNIASPTGSETSDITNTADNASNGASREDVEKCEKYIQDNLSEYVPSDSTYSDYVVDLDFDDIPEIIFFPEYGYYNAFFFKKTGDEYDYAGTVDMGTDPHPLNDFNDIMPCDRNGEKYYYYYYFNKTETHEEKGAAAFRFDENGVRTEGLLSYGAFCGSEDDMTLANYEPNYYKKGESYVEYDEFCELWAEYEGLPPILYEEYWEYGRVTLDNAPYLSNLIEQNALPNIDGSFMFGKRDSCKFNYEGTVNKVILCQKDCGEYKVTLLGYKVRTDSDFDEKMIAQGTYKRSRIVMHRWILVLSDQNGNVLDTESLHEPYKITENECDLPLDEMENCLEVINFGENYVVFFRFAEDKWSNQVLPFAVKNGQLYYCLRNDVGEWERRDYILHMSALYTSKIKGAESLFPQFIITDTLTGKSLFFDFSFKDTVCYTVNDIDILPEYSGETVDPAEYTFVGDVEIPVIDVSGLNYKEQAEKIMENSVPKVLFAHREIKGGGSTYNLYLIGRNVYIYADENGEREFVSFGSIKNAIFKDGEYLGSAVDTNLFHGGGMTRDEYEDNIAKGYYCEEYDALILIRKNPAFSYYGGDCFAAVYNNTFYPNLNGYWGEATDDNKPKWAYAIEDQGFYRDIEVKGNTVTCGFYVYRFEFDMEDFGRGMWEYEVFWRDEAPARTTA